MSSTISGRSQASSLLLNIGHRIAETDELLNNGKVLKKDDLFEQEQYYAMYKDNQAYKDTPLKNEIISALSNYSKKINLLKEKFEATKLKIRKACSHIHSKPAAGKPLQLTYDQKYDYTHPPRIISTTNQDLFGKLFLHQQKTQHDHRPKKNPSPKNVIDQDCKENQSVDRINGCLLLKHRPEYDYTHFPYSTVSNLSSFQELSEYEKFQLQNKLQLKQRRITYNPDINTTNNDGYVEVGKKTQEIIIPEPTKSGCFLQ